MVETGEFGIGGNPISFDTRYPFSNCCGEDIIRHGDLMNESVGVNELNQIIRYEPDRR